MATFTQQFTNDTDGVDTFIDSGATNTNYATSGAVYIGRSNSSGYMYRGLVKFDLSPLPVDSIILSAIISLYSNGNDAANGSSQVSVFRFLRNWVEAQATWNIWATSNNWSTAGAMTNASDVDTTAIAQSGSIAGNLAVGDEITFSLNVTEFTKMVNGTYSNYGFGFKQDSDTSLAYLHEYCSSSHATAGYHPKLVVEYDVPQAPGVMIIGLFEKWKRRTDLYRELMRKGAISLGSRELMPI